MILGFKEYLTMHLSEAAKQPSDDEDDVSSEAGQKSTKDGTVHELLTGWHLNRLIHGKGSHMEHFRDEHQSLEQVLAAHTASMSEKEKEHHNKKASQSAEAIHSHIKATHPEVLNVDKSKGEHNAVTWTSGKRKLKNEEGDEDEADKTSSEDIKHLTGQEDAGHHAGGADIMVTKHVHGKKYPTHAYGASLKYAKSTNPGTQTSQTVGAAEKRLRIPGKLSTHDEKHNKLTDRQLNRTTSKEKKKRYKEISKHLTPAHEKIHKTIDTSSDRRSISQAKALHDHLNNKSLSHEERHHHLLNLIAPEHTHPTYQVRTHKDNDAPTTIHHMSDVVRRTLAKGYHTVHTGRSIKIKAGTKRKPGASLANIEFRAKGTNSHAHGNSHVGAKFNKKMYG